MKPPFRSWIKTNRPSSGLVGPAVAAGLLCLLLGSAKGQSAATEAGGWRVVSPSNNTQIRLPELPPLAVVESRDQSGKTWQIQGTLPGSRAVAERDCRAYFEGQGWRLEKVIRLGRDGRGAILCLWRKSHLDMMLMLFESQLGKTGFAMGPQMNQSPPGQPGSKGTGGRASQAARRKVKA